MSCCSRCKEYSGYVYLVNDVTVCEICRDRIESAIDTENDMQIMHDLLCDRDGGSGEGYL